MIQIQENVNPEINVPQIAPNDANAIIIDQDQNQIVPLNSKLVPLSPNTD